MSKQMNQRNNTLPLTPDSSEHLVVNVDDGYERKQRRFFTNKTMYCLHMIFLVFLLVNVIALYILHFVDRDDLKAETLQFNKPPSSVKEGDVVSLNENGQLQPGAGTSLFLDVAAIEGNQAQFLHFAPPNVMTYYRDNKETVVTTFTVNEKDNSVIISKKSSLIEKNRVRGIAALSSTGYIFLETSILPPYNLYALPGSLSKDNTWTLQSEKKALVANQSVTNSIARLSNTDFAVVYYDDYFKRPQQYQNMKVGRLDSSGNIKLSSALRFGYASNKSYATTFGDPLRIEGIVDAFMTPWFTEAPRGSNVTKLPGLCVTTAKYNPSSNGIDFISESCFDKYQPTHFLDSTLITKNIAAAVFYDKANNFALTVVVLEFSTATSKVFTRGEYIVNSNGGSFDFGNAWSWSPKPDIEVIAPKRVAVAYMDSSNQGKPTVQVLQLTSRNRLADASPEMVFGKKDFNLAATSDKKTSSSFTMDILGISKNSFILGYVGNVATVENRRLCLGTVLGAPIGIATDVDDDESEVSYTGRVKIKKQRLETGQQYYTTTTGQLVKGPHSQDREAVEISNKLIVSSSSKIGQAVDDDHILLSLKQ